MDRREFFKHGMRKMAESAVRHTDDRVSARAARWIRPPHALDELDFLLACTRCGDCVGACPHGVIFTLPARRGAQVAGTPALDLLNHGCRLCADWPCVQACEPGALKFPEPADNGSTPLPRLAFVEVDETTCLPYTGPECGACNGSCPVPGALHWNGDKPSIDRELCTGCALCREACILEPKAIRVLSPHRESAENRTGS